MTILKRLQLDRTLNVQVETYLTDQTGKVRSLKANKAIPIRPEDVYTTSEIVAQPLTPFIIQDIKKSLILSSIGSPFLIDLTLGNQVITRLQCSGLFIWTGAITAVRIYLAPPIDPQAPMPQQRISCQYV